MSRADEGARQPHQENPGGTFNPAGAIPSMEPNWKRYRKCVLEGLKKGVPLAKSLIMTLAIQLRPDEDPPALWERIRWAQGKRTGADPQAAETREGADGERDFCWAECPPKSLQGPAEATPAGVWLVGNNWMQSLSFNENI